MVSCALVICVRGHYYTFIGAVNFHILETETETEKTWECCALCRVISVFARNNWMFVNPLDSLWLTWLGIFSSMLKRREIVYVFAENFWVGARHLGNNCLEESMRTTQNTLGVWSTLFTVKYLLSRKETAFWLNISVDADVVSVERSCLFCAAHVTYQIWVLFTTTECCQPANQRPDSAQFDQSEEQDLNISRTLTQWSGTAEVDSHLSGLGLFGKFEWMIHSTLLCWADFIAKCQR